jgi:phosphopantothenoylcysteine decarboxylase / phosphopantothenate---cysteine ligase
MIPLLTNKRLLLGVTGSIAAYKAADLASQLTQAGAQVEAVLTEAAMQFISLLTLQSVTGRRAYRPADLWGGEAHVLHVGLAERAELLVVAPATADFIARLATGQADDLLALAALAARCPILIAPAMDGGMWAHPATQANVKTMQERGVIVAGPAEGRMASGQVGVGRMLEPDEILGHIRLALARDGRLAGRKIVVTAGGTQEPLDPVRFISNRSSGKQGFALAQVALDRGAEVTLVAGPVALPTPYGARRVDVQTTAEMAEAVLAECVEADVLLMAAAVADFRPETVADQKIKKSSGEVPLVRLAQTTDILAAVAEHRAQAGRPAVIVGFAAESQNVVDNARAKVFAKKLDYIVANDITARDAGFAVDTNRVTIVDAGGGIEALPLLTKTQVAEAVLERVERLLKK